MTQKAEATKGAPPSTDAKESFIRELAAIYEDISTYVGGVVHLRDILMMYETDNFSGLHFEYQSSDPDKVGYFDTVNNPQVTELVGVLDAYKPRLSGK
ncbi:MAG: hypothetical protein K2W94_09265 [Alphaproteobacteria bacterium]|nr:hypothetical protein [Alphaproteobacteria bacterium]